MSSAAQFLAAFNGGSKVVSKALTNAELAKVKRDPELRRAVRGAIAAVRGPAPAAPPTPKERQARPRGK